MVRFNQLRTQEHTHSVEDGVVRYYATAPDLAPDDIAAAFLSGYYQGGSPEPMPVTFRIERLVDDEYRGELLAEFRGVPDATPVRIG